MMSRLALATGLLALLALGAAQPLSASRGTIGAEPRIIEARGGKTPRLGFRFAVSLPRR